MGLEPIRLSSTDFKSVSFTDLDSTPQNMVGTVGLEPTIKRL